jgi:hypothetical protein
MACPVSGALRFRLVLIEKMEFFQEMPAKVAKVNQILPHKLLK